MGGRVANDPDYFDRWVLNVDVQRTNSCERRVVASSVRNPKDKLTRQCHSSCMYSTPLLQWIDLKLYGRVGRVLFSA